MGLNQPDSWWQRLGGPNAITLAAWLLTLPGAVLTPIATASSAVNAGWWKWLVLGFLAHLVSGVVLIAARAWVLPPTPRKPRPWTFVISVSLAGLARGAFIAFAAVAWGIADDLNLGLRLSSAPGSFLLWFALATLIVDGSRRHRATMSLLRERLDREQQIARDSARIVRDNRSAMVERTQRIVTEQLTQAKSLSADPEAAAKRLTDVVDDVVRPLSRELERRRADEARILEEAVTPYPNERTPFRRYLASMFTARPFWPSLTTLTILGTTTYLTVLAIGPLRGTASLAITLAVAWIATTLAAWINRVALNRIQPIARCCMVAAMWLFISVIVAIVLVSVTDQLATVQEDFDEESFIAAIIMTFIVVMVAQSASALVGAVASLRTLAEEELRVATAAVDWAAARLRQHSFLEQQELSKMLHGEVQARIVSVALQIQLNPPADPSAAIAELDAQIQAGLNGSPSSSWSAQLADIEELWSMAIHLSIHCDQRTRDMLDLDLDAARAVIQVVREGVTNAVRHGNAENVSVVFMPGDEVICVSIEDDGDGIGMTSVQGMGTRLLNAVCLEWTLRQEEQTTLQAKIAWEPIRNRGR